VVFPLQRAWILDPVIITAYACLGLVLSRPPPLRPAHESSADHAQSCRESSSPAVRRIMALALAGGILTFNVAHWQVSS
jgi:hypothetical protein